MMLGGINMLTPYTYTDIPQTPEEKKEWTIEFKLWLAEMEKYLEPSNRFEEAYQYTSSDHRMTYSTRG